MDSPLATLAGMDDAALLAEFETLEQVDGDDADLRDLFIKAQHIFAELERRGLV